MLSISRDRVCRGLLEADSRLRRGDGIKVIRGGGERRSEDVLRIEWLNLYNEPEILYSLAGLISIDAVALGIEFDAVASVETSGAKYGVATALLSGVPYFSLHKVGKIIFEDPISVASHSVTEAAAATLYADRVVVSKFRDVLLVDDVRRSSRTITAVADLLREAGSRVGACYVVLDLAFAGHPPPADAMIGHYRPLFVVKSVGEGGALSLGRGVASEFMESSCGRREGESEK